MFAGDMGRGVHRPRDGGTSGSSGRSSQGRSSGARGGLALGVDASIGEGTRARPSSSREPPAGGDDPTGQSSRGPRRLRSWRTIRLIDEDDDDEVPTSPLAAARMQPPPTCRTRARYDGIYGADYGGVSTSTAAPTTRWEQIDTGRPTDKARG